jgi:hypothetical protein
VKTKCFPKTHFLGLGIGECSEGLKFRVVWNSKILSWQLKEERDQRNINNT